MTTNILKDVSFVKGLMEADSSLSQLPFLQLFRYTNRPMRGLKWKAMSLSGDQPVWKFISKLWRKSKSYKTLVKSYKTLVNTTMLGNILKCNKCKICSWSLYYIVGHCIICTINMTVHNHFFSHSAVWEKWDPTLRHVQEWLLGSILPYPVSSLQVFSQNKEVSGKSINNVQNYFILFRCSWIEKKKSCALSFCKLTGWMTRCDRSEGLANRLENGLPMPVILDWSIHKYEMFQF